MRGTSFTAMLTAVALGLPETVLACPVCFGQNDSPLTTAMNAGIMFMLAIVGVVLGGFAAFIGYLIWRGRTAGAVASPSDPQEGIARC
jgi:hypothetical protein